MARNVSYLGGYEPFTDVIEHSKIDLDLINIKKNLGETCGASCELGATLSGNFISG